MGFFKKIGKMAKKRLSIKHLVKMANPINHLKMLNPVHAVKHTLGHVKDARNLLK